MEFKPIIQLKTWLDMEFAVGCPYSCAYCFRVDDGNFDLNKPKTVICPGALVEELEKSPLFIPDMTHLSISGTGSDGFVRQNIKNTFEILSILDKKRYKNSVAIVTKSRLSEKDIKVLESYKNLTLVIFVTYSEMPSSIEKVSNKTRIDTLKQLAQSHIKSVLYWRPIIEGINTSPKQLSKVLEIGEKYADAFVISGLRYSDSISNNINKCGHTLPRIDWEPGQHKTVTKETRKLILELYQKKNCSKPLFYKSSCVISNFEKQPDFNAHWIKAEKNCSPFCPSDQKDICKKQSQRGWANDIADIPSELSREQATYYRQKHRLPIR